MSTGIPRPLSTTVTELSLCTVTSTRSHSPASASSTALSTTSHTRWCSPVSPVDPIYMAGRLRTASRSRRTLMLPASYVFGSCSSTSLVLLNRYSSLLRDSPRSGFAQRQQKLTLAIRRCAEHSHSHRHHDVPVSKALLFSSTHLARALLVFQFQPDFSV